MNLKHLFLTLILSCLFFDAYAQDADSTHTAFRKGRWFTGLSGSISSTTTQVNNANTESSSTNNYGINIQSGKFLKDRFLVGGRFQINKINSSGNFDQSTETLFIGPFSNYYFSNSKDGSLFASLSLGYTRYEGKTKLTQGNVMFQEFAEGGGFGTIIGAGYSYTINDFVAFDLGVNVNLFWVSISQESLPANTITNTSISSNDISFSFGFNIILDDFFF
ncbi:hypothetical protein [Winogradskyella flava]|uniref:hypothetical protein n=1 Tax=Winogradskyella flava TaxID=1884876 RepID=UPI00248F7B0A|nr:hypothetical protein [Winogradskyella flava]